MATLHITEFEALPQDSRGSTLPLGRLPELSTQTVTYTTSTQSVALSDRTKFVRLIADAAAHLAAGDDPSATVSSPWIPANTPEYFAVKGGHKIAAYDGSS